MQEETKIVKLQWEMRTKRKKRQFGVRPEVVVGAGGRGVTANKGRGRGRKTEIYFL